MITNSPAPGLQRFNYFLNELQIIFDKAEGGENPALIIFQENIRTPFFMLEALTRVYEKIHGEKIFRKLRGLFKEMEDSLGAVDYYDGFYKDFTAKKNCPESVIDYLKEKKEACLSDLNRLLENKKWTGKKRKRIRKILQKLTSVPWLPETEDTLKVKKVYKNISLAIAGNFKKNKIHFDTIEGDIHELRRELRWLSIYPQAFRGLMQLKPGTETTESQKKYLTHEIVTSPYNIMPDGAKLQDHILLNANNFYALSWLIAELGKLKDDGLRIIFLNDALGQLYGIKKNKAEELAFAIAGDSQMSIPEILERSGNIATTFFEENNLENLMA
jgi:hypothetical protein